LARREFDRIKPKVWKHEASTNPNRYSPENLERMGKGRAPIGDDGYPMELHHKKPLAEGGDNSLENLQPMTQTEHRRADNYKKNHPNLP
jgi:5-methylcytosine-specific restriction endonuclease McrA